MMLVERKDATDPAVIRLAERFHAISERAYSEREAWPRPRPAHDMELSGYAATMRESGLRLRLYGATPADLAELLTLFRDSSVGFLRGAGFDFLRDRDLPGRETLWVEVGRLHACETALDILAAEQS